jgi:hypothetical protein
MPIYNLDCAFQFVIIIHIRTIQLELVCKHVLDCLHYMLIILQCNVLPNVHWEHMLLMIQDSVFILVQALNSINKSVHDLV